MRCFSIVRSLYFRIFWFLPSWHLCPEIRVSVNIHVPVALSLIIASGLLLGRVLSVCTCWFHHMITLPSLPVSANVCRSRDSVVGIATRYGLEGPGIESWWGEIFRTYPDRRRGPPRPCKMGTGSFPLVKEAEAWCWSQSPYSALSFRRGRLCAGVVNLQREVKVAERVRASDSDRERPS
jgi:hypothetical protein